MARPATTTAPATNLAPEAKPALPSRKADKRKLGLLLLSGIVVGSMIGGGAFNLPQNMAAGAGLGAIALAWGITLVGMFFLSNCFRTLADQRPELKSGIYSYAREGFGRFAGFEMAWGYWLSSAFGNVAFAVLIMQTLGFFFPVLDGKNWQSIAGGSLLIWTTHFMVLSGVKRTAMVNTIASVVNIITLSFGIAIVALVFQKHASLRTGILGTSYASWLLYAADPKFLLMSTILFVIGIPVFWYARREKDAGAPTFTPLERTAAGSLCVVAVTAVVLFATKTVAIG
ncbi:amino acid permease [Paraburkholderia phymatum]|uniref:Amino acid transporter-like protein n=1 Tax=Paraburkholderia phymatum (strain DSM 17167 / CIP 108236 / LMG 21445 / STM815) TaxID=391038 RepID=B2JLL7_PARP8|nr:amino acid permease [Paraburkholderia phymatum]ACC72650.1 Amino acid transporter-like protein [Paraburkholderia phymatum STM815]